MVGASVRGPAHVRAGAPNQDAWYARIRGKGALAVVADGMGSRSASREGARAAVAACRTAWNHWAAAPCGSAEDLVRLIEVCWRLRLGLIPPHDAATTCLVYALRPDGTGVALQLGDGLIGLHGAPGAFRALTPERAAFASETRALGTPHGLRDWMMEPVGALGNGMAVLLASDGVSDDLLPEKRSGFVDWIQDEVVATPKPGRSLAKALRNWPVPRHLDDKTVVLLWEQPDE